MNPTLISALLLLSFGHSDSWAKSVETTIRMNTETEVLMKDVDAKQPVTVRLAYRDGNTAHLDFKDIYLKPDSKAAKALRDRCEQELYKLRKEMGLLEPWVTHSAQGCKLTSTFIHGANSIISMTANVHVGDEKAAKKLAARYLPSCRLVVDAWVKRHNEITEDYPDLQSDPGQWCLGRKGSPLQPAPSDNQEGQNRRDSFSAE